MDQSNSPTTTDSFRLAVVGSRDYPNLPEVRRYVLALPKGTLLVSGGARGVDREAEIAAYLAGLGVHIMFADWKIHGKRAGILRNEKLVEFADKITVFWDGKSPGTLNTLTLAKEAGKLQELFICRRAPQGVIPNNGKFKRLPKKFWDY